MIQPTDKIWRNGEFIPWDEARVHVMTHALHYGTSVFEGIRLLRHPFGTGDFPWAGPYPATLRLGQDLPHVGSWFCPAADY